MRLSLVFLLLGALSFAYAGALHLYISAYTGQDLENPLVRMAHNRLLSRKITAIWAGGMFIFTAIPLITLKM
jgi:hypothetical protein